MTKCNCCDNAIHVDGRDIVVEFDENMLERLIAQKSFGRKKFEVRVTVSNEIAEAICITLFDNR